MPIEVLRINSGLRWKTAIVSPTTKGLQTELVFELNDRTLSVTFDSVPDNVFFNRLSDVRCLGIFPCRLKSAGGLKQVVLEFELTMTTRLMTPRKLQTKFIGTSTPPNGA